MRALLMIALLLALTAPAFAQKASKTTGGCMVGGCSGQLCVEEGDLGVTTCEWLAAYGCYQTHGVCARQKNGKCGWNKTKKLQRCLKTPPGGTPASM